MNRNIVPGMQALGVNALGLSGADMVLMCSDKRLGAGVDYGFVAVVKELNAEFLACLSNLDGGPVLSPHIHPC